MKQNRRSFLKSSATATSATATSATATSATATSATVFAGLINTPGVANSNTTAPGTTAPGTTKPLTDVATDRTINGPESADILFSAAMWNDPITNFGCKQLLMEALYNKGTTSLVSSLLRFQSRRTARVQFGVATENTIDLPTVYIRLPMSRRPSRKTLCITLLCIVTVGVSVFFIWPSDQPTAPLLSPILPKRGNSERQRAASAGTVKDQKKDGGAEISDEKDKQLYEGIASNVIMQFQTLESARAKRVSDYSRDGKRVILYVISKPVPGELDALRSVLKSTLSNAPPRYAEKLSKFVEEQENEFYNFHDMAMRFVNVMVPEDASTRIYLDDGFFQHQSELNTTDEWVMPPSNQMFVRSLEFKKIAATDRFGHLVATVNE